MADKFELSDTTPAPPGGKVNIRWQSDINGNVSAYVDPPGGGGGAVSSVFGRTGAVVAANGDYSASQVTNAVDATQTYSNPSWIGSLAWNKITGAPATGVSSVFGRTGAVTAQSGDYNAAQVTNAVDTTQVYSNPSWIGSLAWSKITGAPSVSSYQTPWLSNIDGANFNLSNVNQITASIVRAPSVYANQLNIYSGSQFTITTTIGLLLAQINASGNVGIGNTATTMPSSLTNLRLLVGQTTASSATGAVVICGNVTAVPAQIGELDFANYALSGTEKRSAIILAATDPVGSYDNAYMGFWTMYAGSLGERMRITASGNVGIANNGATSLTNTGPQLIIGPITAGAPYGGFTACGNTTTNEAPIGVLRFSNYAITAADKRIGEIYGIVGTSPDSGNLVFYTWNAGTAGERMRITANGNVGIGTATPNYQLSLGSNLGNKLALWDGGGGAIYGFGMQSAIMQIYCNTSDARIGLGYGSSASFVEALTVKGRNVGIGSNDPQDALTIYTGNTYVCRMAGTNYGSIWYNDGTFFYLLVTNAGDPLGAINGLRPFYVHFITGVVTIGEGAKCGTAAGIAAAGDMGVSRNSAPSTGVYYFGNTTNKYLYYDGTNFQFNGGSLYVNGTLVSTSDIRTKQNIRDLSGGLPLIEQLKPKEFEFNGLHGTPQGQRAVSLIAQDLQAISPASVEVNRAKNPTTGEMEGLLYYNPQEILMHAVLAIQQLEQRLKGLEERVN